MGFKEKLNQKLQDAYWEKYKDRLTQVHGHVLSVKVAEKVILGFIHLLKVDIVVKPERSKLVVKCQYKKRRFFKKPEFIQVNQGHLVLIQGLKPKKNKKKDSDVIEIMNVINMTTKKELIPIGLDLKKLQQKQIIRK
ncbi:MULTISPECIES: hypothetical protein [Caloramator]|jgi:hypothetical protein|uniref:Conserved protein n=1 Tax=Caloramator australicus RC3 TaxID=857293 RepID=I7K715_9CLOT|nr:MULTISPECIES: hypothetical protein [Caloramator]MDO6354439.1 hypothetical protein [Caloramator sp. CAR-1]CCJ33329.1 Conserved protein [Caloramator australicus RC3]